MKPSPNEAQLSAVGANMSQAIYSVRNSIIMLISLHSVLLYLDIMLISLHSVLLYLDIMLISLHSVLLYLDIMLISLHSVLLYLDIMLISLHSVLLYLDILRCMATHTHRWLPQDFT